MAADPPGGGGGGGGGCPLDILYLDLSAEKSGRFGSLFD